MICLRKKIYFRSVEVTTIRRSGLIVVVTSDSADLLPALIRIAEVWDELSPFIGMLEHTLRYFGEHRSLKLRVHFAGAEAVPTAVDLAEHVLERRNPVAAADDRLFVDQRWRMIIAVDFELPRAIGSSASDDRVAAAFAEKFDDDNGSVIAGCAYSEPLSKPGSEYLRATHMNDCASIMSSGRRLVLRPLTSSSSSICFASRQTRSYIRKSSSLL
jgi:hypothetical protein